MEFNKNGKQTFFNQVRGVITELNTSDEFCSVTLNCGHENGKNVNLVTKRPHFDRLASKHKVGDKVLCHFHVASHYKHGRWYTSAILLDINND